MHPRKCLYKYGSLLVFARRHLRPWVVRSVVSCRTNRKLNEIHRKYRSTIYLRAPTIADTCTVHSFVVCWYQNCRKKLERSGFFRGVFKIRLFNASFGISRTSGVPSGDSVSTGLEVAPSFPIVKVEVGTVGVAVPLSSGPPIDA